MADGRILVASQAATLYAVNAADGKWVWQYRRTPPAGSSSAGRAPRWCGRAWCTSASPTGMPPRWWPRTETAIWDRVLSTGTQFIDVSSTPGFDVQRPPHRRLLQGRHLRPRAQDRGHRLADQCLGAGLRAGARRGHLRRRRGPGRRLLRGDRPEPLDHAASQKARAAADDGPGDAPGPHRSGAALHRSGDRRHPAPVRSGEGRHRHAGRSTGPDALVLSNLGFVYGMHLTTPGGAVSRVIRVVAALIEAEPGRFLVQQRLPGKSRALLWEFPGGKVEPGESDAEALIREGREELGVRARGRGAALQRPPRLRRPDRRPPPACRPRRGRHARSAGGARAPGGDARRRCWSCPSARPTCPCSGAWCRSRSAGRAGDSPDLPARRRASGRGERRTSGPADSRPGTRSADRRSRGAGGDAPRPSSVPAIDRAEEALERGDLAALAALLPIREHWRLWPLVRRRGAVPRRRGGRGGRAAQRPTVVGVPRRHGLATFIERTEPGRAPRTRWRSTRVWVTFNGGLLRSPGAAPRLRRAADAGAPPRPQPLCRRIGLGGGSQGHRGPAGHRPASPSPRPEREGRSAALADVPARPETSRRSGSWWSTTSTTPSSSGRWRDHAFNAGAERLHWPDRVVPWERGRRALRPEPAPARAAAHGTGPDPRRGSARSRKLA